MIKAINRSRTLKFTGVAMLSVGLVFILGFGSLYMTGLISESNLDGLNAVLSEPPTSHQVKSGHSNVVFATTTPSMVTTHKAPPKKLPSYQKFEVNNRNANTQVNHSVDNNKSQKSSENLPIQFNNSPDMNNIPKELMNNSAQSIESFNKLIAGYSSIQLVKNIHPKDWANPIWSEVDVFVPYESNGILQDQENELLSGPALSMQIPLIGVDSNILNLSIIEENGIKSYESPKNIVGRIPTDDKFKTSVPGWFFGHLESPIKGEGNVFHNLPQVAQHLRNGDPVYIHIKNENREFIYQAHESQVIHKSEMQLYDLGIQSIMLVTCANRPYYDYRQMVKAHLIDIK